MRHSVCATLAVATCACTLSCARRPGATPQSAIEHLQEAHAAKDYGAVFDLMSARQRTALTEAVAGIAREMRDAPPFARQLVGIDAEKLAALSPREGFIEMMHTHARSTDALGKAMGADTSASENPVWRARVIRCDAKGDRATVTLEGVRTAITLVREDGLWRVDTPLTPMQK
jgi:hypothetical protein